MIAFEGQSERRGEGAQLPIAIRELMSPRVASIEDLRGLCNGAPFPSGLDRDPRFFFTSSGSRACQSRRLGPSPAGTGPPRIDLSRTPPLPA